MDLLCCQDPVLPSALLQSIRRLLPQFEGNQQEDAHELLVTLLTHLQDVKLSTTTPPPTPPPPPPQNPPPPPPWAPPAAPAQPQFAARLAVFRRLVLHRRRRQAVGQKEAAIQRERVPPARRRTRLR